MQRDFPNGNDKASVVTTYLRQGHRPPWCSQRSSSRRAWVLTTAPPPRTTRHRRGTRRPSLPGRWETGPSWNIHHSLYYAEKLAHPATPTTLCAMLRNWTIVQRSSLYVLCWKLAHPATPTSLCTMLRYRPILKRSSLFVLCWETGLSYNTH